MPRPRRPRDPAARRRLEKFARAYLPEIQRFEELRYRRDEESRLAYLAGIPMEDIAETLARILRQAARSECGETPEWCECRGADPVAV